MGESRTLARERGIRAGAWRGKGGLHSEGMQAGFKEVKEGKQGELPRCRRKHERVIRHKSSPRGSAESWFHS